jgi:probable DNA repair protein
MFALDRQAGHLGGRWLPAGAAQLVWERLVRDDPELSPLLSPAGVARSAYQSWRRLHDYCIPFGALDGDDSVETAAFARWCRQYVQLLESRSWLDAVLAQTKVQAAAAGAGLEIVGFDRLTPLQELLLARWAEAGLEVRRLDELATTAAVRRVHCLDAAAEIDAAARWAAAALHERRDRRIAIVVPDLGRRREDVRRRVERVLVPAAGVTDGPAPESQGFELAAARPLAEQPVVAAALDLLDVFLRPPDLQALSRLLRNPFLAGAAEEGAARARLDARLRRYEAPGLGLPGLQRMADERGCPALGATLVRTRDVVSKWPEKDLPTNCANYIFNALAALGWPGSALDSNEHQAEQRMRSLVSELGGYDEFTGRVTRTEAVGLLREMAARVLFEPQELRAPLLVIDPETSAGMHFDALWVAGLDATRWPSPASPDPFLPKLAQARHGVPRATAELAAREARVILERLLASAPEVVVSVPEMEDDASLLPSPLLDGLEVEELPAQWPEPRLGTAIHAAGPALESVADSALPAIARNEASRGGARLLELQAACPFRAQAELRLGARALEEPGVGVDAAERGDLVHEALALLWRELRTQDALKSLDRGAVQALVQRAVAAALADARRAADGLMRHLLDLEAEWLEGRVLAMVDADLERAPFVVEQVEEPRTARVGALSLELRPDRVDRLLDGSLAVIDYKTGANAEVNAWLDERPKLPQLPAYVHAVGAEQVGAVAFARLRSGDTRYAGLARSEDTFRGLKVPGAKGWPRDYASWDDLLGAWHRRLEALADEYAAGDARLAPDPARACEYCHLGALCRIAGTDAARAQEQDSDE